MVRNYSPKLSAFPGARKEEGFYADILRFAVLGFTGSEIALILNAPPQTVNRVLRHIRSKTTEHSDLWLEFMAELDVRRPRDRPAFDEVYNGIYPLPEAPEAGRGIRHLTACLTDCPRGLSPRAFVERHITIFPLCQSDEHAFPSNAYPFRLAVEKGGHKLDEYFSRKLTCRFCPLGGAHKEAMGALNAASSLYAAMKLHLSQVRLRSDHRAHILFALLRGLIGEILAEFVRMKHREGLDEKVIENLLVEEFNWVVAMCWAAMAGELRPGEVERR